MHPFGITAGPADTAAACKHRGGEPGPGRRTEGLPAEEEEEERRRRFVVGRGKARESRKRSSR